MKLKRPSPSPVLSYVELSDAIGVSSNTRSRAGKKAKTKGASFERRIVKELGEWWKVKFYRTPQSGGSHLAEGYELAGDIATPDAEFRFHVECKNQEALGKFYNFMLSEKAAVWKWWDQCSSECASNRVPLLVFTRNHMPAWAMMRSSFFDILCRMELEEKIEKGTQVIKAKGYEFNAHVIVNDCVVITLDRLFALSKGVVINSFVKEGKLDGWQ